MEINITQKNIILTPPDYLDALHLHYYEDNGWIINFAKGDDMFGNKNYYTKFKNFCIFGNFCAFEAMKYTTKEDYLFVDSNGNEKLLLEWIQFLDEDYFDACIQNSITEHPDIKILNDLIKLNKQ